MKYIIIDQFKKIIKHPFEFLGLCFILLVVITTFMTIKPLTERLNEPVNDYINAQNTEDFHVSMGMIDFNHLTGSQRNDVFLTMNLYGRFPALDESDPYQMNAVNRVIQEEIYQYPALVDRLYNSIIKPVVDTHGFDIEKSLSVTLEDDDYLYRFISINETINIPIITEGELPTAQEIAVFEAFADANGLSIGDQWVINDIEYTISGFFYSPQFILPAIKSTSLQYDPSTQSVVLAQDDTILAMNEPFKVYYQGKGDFTVLSDTFDIYDILQSDFQVYGRNMRMVETVVPREYNLRIHAVLFETELTETFVLAFLGIFTGFSLVLVFLFIKHWIDKQQKDILVLHQLGYSNTMIAKAVSLLSVFLSLTILIAGCLGLWLSKTLFMHYSARYIMPIIPFSISLEAVLIGMVLPILLILVLSYLYSYSVIIRLNKEHTMTLLRLRFKKVLTVMSQGFLFVLIATLLLVSLFSRNLIDDFKESSLQGKVFEEMVYLYQYTNEPLNGRDAFAHRTLEIVQINGAYIHTNPYTQGYGLSPTTSALRLINNDPEMNALLEDGIIISKHLAFDKDLSVGDTLTLRVGNVIHKDEVVAIADELIESAVYLDKETFITLIGFSDMNMYNGYFNTETNSDDVGYVFKTVNYRVLVQEVDYLFRLSNQLTYYMMSIASFLALFMFYFLMRQSLLKAQNSFLTLKALGYSTVETYRIFFVKSFMVLVGAFALSIMFSSIIINLILRTIFSRFGLVFPFTIPVLMTLIALFSMVFVIGLITALVHHAFAQKPLSELLKKV